MNNDRESLKGLKIKFFTRSFSLEMYQLAKSLFDGMGIPCVRLTDKMADGYFYSMLKDTDCDIAINIDEDAFLVGEKSLWDLVEYVVENNYANAGCPDGGAGAPREGNPIVTNPFFNVLNLRCIRERGDVKKQVGEFDYIANREALEAGFPKPILFGDYDFGKYDYEPYYPFFFWVASNFNTLYLPSSLHSDGISTQLYNHNNEPLCYHSWFARFFNVSPFHTKRIKKLYKEALEIRGLDYKAPTQVDKLHFFIDFCMRRLIRIPMRILNWPNKWKKWYKRYQLSKNKL